MKKGKYLLKIILKIVCYLMIFVMTFSFVICGSVAVYIQKNVTKSIDDELFSMLGGGTETSIYYYERNNETGELIPKPIDNEILYGGYRSIYADYTSIPDDLKDAFVAIEDKRFYSHKGVDWKRTVSAGVNYFIKYSDSFGGSTITQQLIKNVTDKDEYSLKRKIQEIFWALDLETKMSKDEILGIYLNIINLSQGCYGVAAAADHYFSKDISELTLNECACIAAITNSPSYYDPIRNPENNKRRKDIILSQMYDQGYISEAEYSEAWGKDVTLNVNEKYSSDDVNSWYIDMVIEDVINDLIEQKGYTRVVANLAVYTGGLKIYTAMDPEIQNIMDQYYRNLGKVGAFSGEDAPQSSMIIIDPYTGDILGVTGAIGEKNANRIQNFATQTLRPPGSVIKPLSVYAPALDSGIINWATVYDDTPVEFKGEDMSPWPKNSNGNYRGLTNINYAIKNSLNTVTVKALSNIGLENSFVFLRDNFGMKDLIRNGTDGNGNAITDIDYAALALGQLNYGVTVRDITAAYCVFANKGIYSGSRSYYKVTDGYGSIILENRYKGTAAISEANATIMSMMLENVVKDGTAKSLTLKNTISCAGKTGTTQNNYDRWYIGYTPQYVGGVWYGYEYPKAISGTNLCIEIWDDVMSDIYKRKGTGKKTFEYSNEVFKVEYCADSGKLMTDACRCDPRGDRAEQGYFTSDNQPEGYCDRHVTVEYDTLFGGISLDGCCGKDTIQNIGLLKVERNFPIQVYVEDAQYVWQDIKSDILPETSPYLPFFNNSLDGFFCGLSKSEWQFNRICRHHFDYNSWLEKKKMYE